MIRLYIGFLQSYLLKLVIDRPPPSHKKNTSSDKYNSCCNKLNKLLRLVLSQCLPLHLSTRRDSGWTTQAHAFIFTVPSNNTTTFWTAVSHRLSVNGNSFSHSSIFLWPHIERTVGGGGQHICRAPVCLNNLPSWKLTAAVCMRRKLQTRRK